MRADEASAGDRARLEHIRQELALMSVGSDNATLTRREALESEAAEIRLRLGVVDDRPALIKVSTRGGWVLLTAAVFAIVVTLALVSSLT